MGNPLAPVLADIFISKIEQNFLQKYQQNIPFYQRFVDDNFGCWLGTRSEFNDFVNFINQIHPKIKYTTETEVDKSLNFLDLKITRIPNSGFKTTIHRKPTAVIKPLHFTSAHHPKQKWGTLTSAILRARKLITEEEDLWKEIKFVQSTYINQAYPPHLILRTIQKALKKDLWSTNNQNNKVTLKETVYSTIPYIHNISTKISQNWNSTLRNFGFSSKVCCSYKPNQNIYSTIKNLKRNEENGQQQILNQQSVVYGVSCAECDEGKSIKYVGETSRRLRDRVNSHMAISVNPSAIRCHKHAPPYHSNFKYSILGKEFSASKRKFLEAVYNKSLQPPWNGDNGTRKYCVT